MITQQRLKEILDYDPNTGVFTWLCDRGGSIKAGQVAGCIDKNTGYQVITADYRTYKSHRLAWLYMYGYWPDQIDHKNGNKIDNRLTNLREVNHQENAQNRGRLVNNKYGCTGVFPSRNKANPWSAVIIVKGEFKFLGNFSTLEDAIKARKEAELIYQPLRVVES